MDRRTFLRSISALSSSIILTGCTSTNNVEEYPPGLSEDGITDIELLLDEDSAYIDSDFVEIVINSDVYTNKIKCNNVEEKAISITNSREEDIEKEIHYTNSQGKFIRLEFREGEVQHIRHNTISMYDREIVMRTNLIKNVLQSGDYIKSSVTDDSITYESTESIENTILNYILNILNLNIDYQVIFGKDGRLKYIKSPKLEISFEYTPVSVEEPNWINQV